MFRWTAWDLIRNALDWSARQGRLPPQDDLRLLGAEVDELPYDKLVREAEAIGFKVIDLRQLPRTGRGKARGTRKLQQVTALLWHQTAAMLSMLQADGVPAHALVYRDTIVLLHPLRAYLYHAGVANKFTIGIEVVCRACGIEGDLRTLWRSKRERNGYTRKGKRYPPKAPAEVVSEATDGQVEACRLLGAYYVAEVDRQAELEDVDAGIVASMLHRNSESDRVGDPGSKIAAGAAKPVAEAHGLEYGSPVVGSGKQTPTIWGGDVGHPYNWRVRGY